MKIAPISLAFSAFLFVFIQKCSTQPPSAPPGFKPKPFKVDPTKIVSPLLPSNGQELLGGVVGTATNLVKKAILTPAEAHKKIFGNLDADKPEKVQKRIKELEKVRDLIAEYNELLAKKAAEQGPPAKPLSERQKQKFESMQVEVAAVKESRAKTGKPVEEEKDENMNEVLEGYVIEGDIIPTVENMEDRIDRLKGVAPRNRSSNSIESGIVVKTLQPKKLKPQELARSKRGLVNFANYPSNKWVSTVYWMMSSDLSSQIVKDITAAFAFYYATTCLYFTKVETAPASPTPYMLLQRGSTGVCNSYVGRVSPPNVINLGDTCTNSAPHEIGHALGLHHTQNRHDQANFVEVHLENAKNTTNSGNYDPETTYTNDNQGVLYDYGSRMHYGAMDFSNATKGLPVLIAKEPNHQNTMGQRWGMAFSDHLMLNRAYCSGSCPAGQAGVAACKNGGYPNPNWCDQCLCPTGWSGTLCDQRQPASSSNANCTGTTITATTSWQLLKGSVTNLDGRDGVVEHCHWHIKVPTAGQKLSLWIDEVAPTGEVSCNYGCTNGDVEFKVDNFTRTGYRMCCQSDLAPNGYVQLTSPSGFAIINANTRYYKKAFSVWYIAYN